MTFAQEISALREMFTTIRDERRTHANTATRVGSAFLALLDYLADAPFIRKDLTGEKLEDPVLAELLSREDVILTPHVAFFTETSVSNLIRLSLESLIEFETTGTCEREVYRT